MEINKTQLNKKIWLSNNPFYDLVLEKNIVAIDLSEMYTQNKIETVLYRNDDYIKAITILNCKRKNNLMVIGKSGVGKTAFIHGLARYIKIILPNHSLAEVNVAALLSGSAYRGDFEKKLTFLIEQAIVNNIIIYFDEAHTLRFTGGENTGGIDAINILKPHLTKGFRCICSTTTDEFQFLKSDLAFSRRFRILELKQLLHKENKEILIQKFGLNDTVKNYLEDTQNMGKELFEMIDDVDLLTSYSYIREIKNEV